MINLPLLHSFDLTGYGMFPGVDPDKPALRILFRPGLTLVLGANGLGKTTLVTMLYRMLTGPRDIPALMRGGDLGTASLRVAPIRGNNRRVFAQRVADRAKDSVGHLVFDLGDSKVSIVRNLADLSLVSCTLNSSNRILDEDAYQKAIMKLANVSSFGDWIVLLRYIVFYFEDRRSLVWDPSAQRQLLRILFLQPDRAKIWTDREREILEADTRVRNMRAVASGMEWDLARDESLEASKPKTQEQIREFGERLQKEEHQLDQLSSRMPELAARSEQSRLDHLTLEQQRDSKFRELEKAHLSAVATNLPHQSDSARYILAQLLTDSRCRVCGTNVPDVVDSLEARLRNSKCVLCGSNMVSGGERTPHTENLDAIWGYEDELRKIDVELEAARNQLADASKERNQAVDQIQKLKASIAVNRNQMDELVAQLPPEESQMHEQRQELISLRATVEARQNELNEMRSRFKQIIDDATSAVLDRTSEIHETFGDFAGEFLLENCRLLWSPQPARLGQAGRRFDFPAFELNLSGSNFSGPVRRHGPGDVSESQREFIDVAFRMALANVATEKGVSSLVLDAPESSLDTIFVHRAARVLGVFGHTNKGNRLVVTSNLISGDLIPSLLQQSADEHDRAERVVDLLSIAAPTAALNLYRTEYEQARDELLERANALPRESQ